MKDPTKFRKRFAMWKEGKKPYKNGRISDEEYVQNFKDGKLPEYRGGRRGMRLNEKLQLTIRYIYNRLSNAGFDQYAIAGILGNAMQESAMDPNIVNKFGFRGLFQNSKAILNSISSIYGDHSIDSLLGYIIDWTNQNRNILSKLHAPVLGTYAGRYKKTGYTSAEEAGRAFMRLYERPVIIDPKTKSIIGYQDEARRLLYSAQMLDYLNKTFGTKNTTGKSQFVRYLEENPTPLYEPPTIEPDINAIYDAYTKSIPLLSTRSSSGGQSYIIPLPNIAQAYNTFFTKRLSEPVTKRLSESIR